MKCRIRQNILQPFHALMILIFVTEQRIPIPAAPPSQSQKRMIMGQAVPHPQKRINEEAKAIFAIFAKDEQNMIVTFQNFLHRSKNCRGKYMFLNSQLGNVGIAEHHQTTAKDTRSDGNSRRTRRHATNREREQSDIECKHSDDLYSPQTQ